MRPFALEHSPAGFRADILLHGAATVALVAVLLLGGPWPRALELAALALAGLGGWTLVEYVVHRFVLHGVPPFRGWHMQHHQRPHALLGTPTVVSIAAIGLLLFLPALLLGDLWRACALTLGLTAGYLAYTLTHHATHHRAARSPWLAHRKRWHAAHHHGKQPGCYGVTSGFWDGVFGTTPKTFPSRPARGPV
jgi:sterol desaturase/sphingolipid hydroxylase (fatty acid hydroxylase superfamily)